MSEPIAEQPVAGATGPPPALATSVPDRVPVSAQSEEHGRPITEARSVNADTDRDNDKDDGSAEVLGRGIPGAGTSASAKRRRRRRRSSGSGGSSAGPGVSAGAESSPSSLISSQESSDPASLTAANGGYVGEVGAPVQPAGQQVASSAHRPQIGDTRPAPEIPVPPTREPASRSRRGARGSAGGSRSASGSTAPSMSPPPEKANVTKAASPERKGDAVRPAVAKNDKEQAPGVSDYDAAENDGSDESRGSGAAGRSRRRSGRERGGKAVGRYLMCVHVSPGATQIAVLEGRTLVEHVVSRVSDDDTQIDGNVYRGRVQNVLPGMEAAFIDIGTPKNAVLYRGDVRFDREDVETSHSSSARIEQMLRAGQTILCQVTKNPIGAKGARLTQEVSLPGRFVVMVPNSTAFGISKRLDDGERRRLRKIVDDIRPKGHGLIVRTAAEGASVDELRNDVERLVRQWQAIEVSAAQGSAPGLLYREPDLAVRIVREEFNRDYRGVVIDDPELFAQVHDYVSSINPELADRVEYYDRALEPLPIFERHHVHEQLHKALDRKVWLPSGGSLIIERTEALTVIDVNTGKNVGKSNLEETVYRNNLEAAEETARQLRLRDIGGIIVIDFIDMEIRENRDKVASALRSALARDKTRTQVFDISELGLVEMTRKRISEGLVESLSTSCPVCEGRGIVFDEALL